MYTSNINYKFVLRKKPIWTCGVQIWGKNPTFINIPNLNHSVKLHQRPFYVTNHWTLYSVHRLDCRHKRFRCRLANHPNPLISVNISDNPLRTLT